MASSSPENNNPVPFSHLLELELRTGIRLKHGRGEMTAAEQRGALKALESDLANGILARPDYDLDVVYRRAETSPQNMPPPPSLAPPTSGMLPPLSKSAVPPLPLSMAAKESSRPSPS